MKIYFIGLLFILISCSQQGTISLPKPPEGWVLVKSKEDLNYSYLATSVTESKNKYGNFVYFWVLINEIEHNKNISSESSSKSKFIIRCTDKRIRSERQITYSKFNGSGTVVSDSEDALMPSTMKEIVPGSIGDTFYNILCKRI